MNEKRIKNYIKKNGGCYVVIRDGITNMISTTLFCETYDEFIEISTNWKNVEYICNTYAKRFLLDTQAVLYKFSKYYKGGNSNESIC